MDCPFSIGDNGKLLAHCVELLGELALLVSSLVLVNDTVCSSLVDLLDGSSVGCLSSLHVACLQSSIVLLDLGLELGLDHLVLQRLNSGYANALLRRFDIRHV